MSEPDRLPPEEPASDKTPLTTGSDCTDSNLPSAPYGVRNSHVVAAVILLLIVILYSFIPLYHTDSWGHLAYGRWIAGHGSLPEREPFSPFADKRARYVNFQWLSQAGLYQVYHLGEEMAGGDAIRRTEGGVALLRTLTVALAVGYFLLMFAACRRRSDSQLLGCVGMAVVIAMDPGVLGVLRPQVFGQVLFAGLLLVLSRPVITRRAVLFVPCLFVLWANLHGSFLVGLFLIGLCLLGRIIETQIASGETEMIAPWRDPQGRRLLLVLLLSAVAAGLLNPEGPRLYLATLELSNHPGLVLMNEWRPLWESRGIGPFVIYGASLLVVIVSFALGRQRPTATELILLLIFGLLPLWQRRMLVWWVPLVVWIMVRHWAAWMERSSPGWLRGDGAPSFQRTKAMVIVGLAVIALLWTAPVRWLTAGRPTPLQTSATPVTPWQLAAQLTSENAESDWSPALAKTLKENYTNGRFAGRILPSETLGDYLLWSLPDEWPVLVYTHVHLFTFVHYRDCLAALDGAANRKQLLDRHRVNLVVVEAMEHARFCEQMRKDADWIVVADERPQNSSGVPQSRLFVAIRRKPL